MRVSPSELSNNTAVEHGILACLLIIAVLSIYICFASRHKNMLPNASFGMDPRVTPNSAKSVQQPKASDLQSIDPPALNHSQLFTAKLHGKRPSL